MEFILVLGIAGGFEIGKYVEQTYRKRRKDEIPPSPLQV
jgi:hypothetical protein